LFCGLRSQSYQLQARAQRATIKAEALKKVGTDIDIAGGVFTSCSKVDFGACNDGITLGTVGGGDDLTTAARAI
jgi:hypothetical protein